MQILKIFRRILLGLLFIPALQADARKIVSLSPAMTEVIYQLGKGHELVGRSSACDYPADVKKLPIAGNLGDPDMVKILKIRPDVVVTNDLIVPAAAKTLQQYHIKVFNFSYSSISEYREMVQQLGKELHAEKAAADEIARIDKFIADCRKWKKLDKKILCLIWHHPLIAAGDRSMMNELLELAGASNCVKENINGYFQPSAKFLLNCQADTLLIFENPKAYTKQPVLKHLEAVKKNQVICFPNADLLQRPGPRFTEGVLKLREYLEK